MYIQIEKITDTKAKSLGQWHESIVTDEMKKTMIQVGKIPTAEEREGKQPVLYVNPETLELWYEYEPRPLTDAERIVELEKTQGDLLMEIAMLKMGGSF